MEKHMKYKSIKIILFTFVITIILSIYVIFLETNNHNYYIKITSQEIKEEISSNENIIIYFYKDNCSPCSKFKVLLNKYIEENRSVIFAINVNDDSSKYFELTDEYNINYTPTMIAFKENKEQKRIEGIVGEEELDQFIKEVEINDKSRIRNVMD